MYVWHYIYDASRQCGTCGNGKKTVFNIFCIFCISAKCPSFSLANNKQVHPSDRCIIYFQYNHYKKRNDSVPKAMTKPIT